MIRQLQSKHLQNNKAMVSQDEIQKLQGLRVECQRQQMRINVSKQMRNYLKQYFQSQIDKDIVKFQFQIQRNYKFKIKQKSKLSIQEELEYTQIPKQLSQGSCLIKNYVKSKRLNVWDQFQVLKYFLFVKKYQEALTSLDYKVKFQINKKMALFIQTRNTQNCTEKVINDKKKYESLKKFIQTYEPNINFDSRIVKQQQKILQLKYQQNLTSSTIQDSTIQIRIDNNSFSTQKQLFDSKKYISVSEPMQVKVKMSFQIIFNEENKIQEEIKFKWLQNMNDQNEGIIKNQIPKDQKDISYLKTIRQNIYYRTNRWSSYEQKKLLQLIINHQQMLKRDKGQKKGIYKQISQEMKTFRVPGQIRTKIDTWRRYYGSLQNTIQQESERLNKFFNQQKLSKQEQILNISQPLNQFNQQFPLQKMVQKSKQIQLKLKLPQDKTSNFLIEINDQIQSYDLVIQMTQQIINQLQNKTTNNKLPNILINLQLPILVQFDLQCKP